MRRQRPSASRKALIMTHVTSFPDRPAMRPRAKAAKRLGAVAGAVAAIAAVAGASSVAGSRYGAASLRTATTTGVASGHTAACNSSHLAAQYGGAGLYQNLAQFQLNIVNTGRTPCTIPTGPELTGLDSRGTPVAISYVRRPDTPVMARSGGTVTLRPGQRAYSILSSPAWCAAIGRRSRVLRSVSAHLPSGAVTDSRWQITIACGTPVATKFAIASPPAPPARPLVTAQLTAPVHAAAGGTIRFAVRITSTSRGLIALHPCPAFRVGVFGTGINVSRSARVSCTAKFLAPGNTIALHGRMRIPSRARGVVKLLWSTPGFGGVTAGRSIDIRS
jgi:Protein of unknown function (DUF4232)